MELCEIKHKLEKYLLNVYNFFKLNIFYRLIDGRFMLSFFVFEIKERKNRVCIRLFFFPSFIVLNRLDVFILRLVCLYWVATLITNTINSIDRIVWIDRFDWNHDSNQREIFRIMTNELFWNLTKSRKVYKRNLITLKFIKYKISIL